MLLIFQNYFFGFELKKYFIIRDKIRNYQYQQMTKIQEFRQGLDVIFKQTQLSQKQMFKQCIYLLSSFLYIFDDQQKENFRRLFEQHPITSNHHTNEENAVPLKQSLQKINKNETILVGETAAGKSSLLNYYFKEKLPIGLGDCTENISCIKSNKHIYDSSPIKQSSLIQDYYDYDQYIRYDRIFVLYPYTLKQVSNFLKILVALENKEIYFIRTKCDLFDGQVCKSYQQQRQNDKKYLKQMGFKEELIKMYGVSMKKDMKFMDNKIVKSLLINK